MPIPLVTGIERNTKLTKLHTRVEIPNFGNCNLYAIGQSEWSHIPRSRASDCLNVCGVGVGELFKHWRVYSRRLFSIDWILRSCYIRFNEVVPYTCRTIKEDLLIFLEHVHCCVVESLDMLEP